MTIVEVLDAQLRSVTRQTYILVNGVDVTNLRVRHKIMDWLMKKMDEGKVTTHRIENPDYIIVVHVVEEDLPFDLAKEVKEETRPRQEHNI